MRSFVPLRFVQRRLVVSPIFKGQPVKYWLTLEYGADRLSETSATNYQSTLRKIPEERSSNNITIKIFVSKTIYQINLGSSVIHRLVLIKLLF